MKSARRNRWVQPTFFRAVLCVSILCASFLLHFQGGKPRSSERSPLLSAPVTLSRLPIAPKLGVQPYGPHPLESAAAFAKPFVETKKVAARSTTTKKRAAKKIAKAKAEISKVATTIAAIDPTPVFADVAENSELDVLLDESLPIEADEIVAFNLIDGADLAVDEALSETTPEEHAVLSSPTSSLLADTSYLMDVQIAREPRVIETVGVYKRNEFSDIRGGLNSLKEEATALGVTANPASRSTSPMPELIARPSAPTKVAELMKRDLVRATPLQPTVAKGVPDETTSGLITRPSTEDEDGDAPELAEPHAADARKLQHENDTIIEASVLALAASAPTLMSSAPVLASVGPSLSAPVAKVAASVAAPTLSAAATAPRSLVTQTVPAPPVPRVVNQSTTQPLPPAARTLALASRVQSPVVDTDFRDAEMEGKVFGRLEVADSVAAFLQREKGHIELYLHPVASRVGEDTIFVDYHYPTEDFEFDASGLVGEYRLAAGLYTPKETTPYAQIWYSKTLSASSLREKIRFEIGEAEVRTARSNAAPSGQKLSFRATLFEGAAGDHRQAKAIPNGEVRVVGFPEWGIFQTDADGNFLIPSVPSASQIILETRAPGFYPSFHTVPIFSAPVYTPLYLIGRDKVDTITKFFTKNPQMPGQALVMGRVFNAQNRRPLKGEEVSLSFERNRALYFDAFPDKWLPSTTDTGLFGFFNVSPSMRFVQRSKNTVHSMLMNLRPNTAQYVEIGRGGAKTLKARLLARIAPATEQPVGFAKVRIVGDKRQEVFSDAEGNFDVPGVDLPSGVLTLEVEAEGYPRTWQTIAWNPREPERRLKLYMMPRLQVAARSGAIYGDSREKFFSKKVKCLFVSLQDAQGRAMDKSHGPFRFDSEAYASSGRTFELEEKATASGQLCLNPNTPNFTFLGLGPGEYILKWHDERFRTKRTRVIHVSAGRLSVVVN